MNRRTITLLAAGHFLIDLCQGTVPALLPFLVVERHFSYTAAASLVFAISASSSVVQPFFGQVADRLALAWLLPASIVLTGTGLALGAQATLFVLVLLAFALSGLGVAAFHPEAARQAFLASGDRRATGMSWFTVGGVVGFALGRMLTTALVVGWGIKGVLVLLLPTGLVAGLLVRPRTGAAPPPASPRSGHLAGTVRDDWKGFAILSGATICRSIVFFGLNTFLALYFMSRWSQSTPRGTELWHFLGTSIAGTLMGGFLADRFGRRSVLRAGFAGACRFLDVVCPHSQPDPGAGAPGSSGRLHLSTFERTGGAGSRVPANPGWHGLGHDPGSGRERRRHGCPSPGPPGRLAWPEPRVLGFTCDSSACDDPLAGSPASRGSSVRARKDLHRFDRRVIREVLVTMKGFRIDPKPDCLTRPASLN